ncbi:MAG TPA: TIGR03435 family protein [Bryobacteraceae bacterium]|nr:TIGR03435 family protein [Bryobacteraceae bacterium]
MQDILSKITICLALAAASAFAETKPAFEVATIKPAPPMDMGKIAAALQAGGKMPIGANVDSVRAEYRYLDLRSLISYAYGVKPYQITGPDWMATTHFDIVAKMPEGSKKEDAPKMLQTLLEDRFKLTTHRASAEHPVLALVVGKGGPKLKASAEKPIAIDESAPLKPGESKMDGSTGPVRVKIDMTTGSSVIDMGLQGKMAFRLDPAKGTMHLDFSMTTMTGFADMVTQLFAQLGGTGGRQVVDMTGIQGNYDATVDLGLAEIIAMARAAGADIPAGGPVGTPGGPAGPGNAPAVASDPSGGGTSLADAVQSMGLKLESRKATVDQLVVDHIEKTPTEN